LSKEKFGPFKVLLELEGEKRISGNNLFDLLDKITVRGSIRQASSDLGFSYRYAWGLIREAEKALGFKLVEKQAGGVSGGGTFLTREGGKLLDHYRSFKEEVQIRLHQFMDQAALTSTFHESGNAQYESSTGKNVIIASTIEPVETGLLDALEQSFYQSTCILLRHIAVGSGRALDIAREGKVDMVLSHAPELEAQFMAEGWGYTKMPLMTNDLMVIGPSGHVLRNVDIVQVFKEIAASGLAFVSRGDQSGTHLREQKIWEVAGIEPEHQDWYLVSPGVAGNLGVLSLANEIGAFTLVDRASFMLSKENIDLEIITSKENDPEAMGLLQNVFVLITVNPERFSSVNHYYAHQFISWLEDEGKKIISDFGKEKYGTPLFHLYS